VTRRKWKIGQWEGNGLSVMNMMVLALESSSGAEM
jgi:hypothetical protein